MALPGPTNLVLVSQSLASAVLAWSPVPRASPAAFSYNVYRDMKILASGIALLTYTDSTVRAGHHYTYRVTALLGGVETIGTDQLRVDILQGNSLTFESVFQEQPGEGGYPDILWRWQ